MTNYDVITGHVLFSVFIYEKFILTLFLIGMLLESDHM